jgi:hypothetical protein
VHHTSMGSNFIRRDTGETHRFAHQFAPGAMWLATWLDHPNWPWSNPAGPHLCVMTPGGEWDIDSRANNCTLPLDTVHRCWVRSGTPPCVTVDKVGFTCSAGQGSIRAGNFHGFLRNGVLIPC